MLSAALAGSRTITFCLAASQALLGRDILSFLDSRQGILAASSGMLATPGLLLARPEPPGRLHSSTGSPHELLETRSLESPERRQPYPDCSGAFSVTGRPAIGNRHEAWTYDGPVSASRHPGRTYEPLDVFVLSVDVARQRF
jgi:hypothetical protein